MTRALYLLGAPATGKSSLMEETLNLLGYVTGEWYMPWPVKNKEFRVEPLEDVVSGELRGVSLGVTRPGGFPGTDGLGMAASPDAVAWATEAELPERIVGEGQRLGSVRFLSPLAVRTELLVVHLVAPTDVLDARCKARGSEQTTQFRRAGATRSRNVAGQLEMHGVSVVTWNTAARSLQEMADELATRLS